MIKLLSQIDARSLLKEYHLLEKDIRWTDYGHKGKQAGLQYRTDEDQWASAVGKSKEKETEYINLNPVFKDTIFEEIINKYKLLRTRLMWVGPYACYSMHKDQTPRIHVPIITNPECYFVFKNGTIQHMLTNSIYWADTTQYHTFMNCSNISRLHLIGAVTK
jgi:hypothetical protein